MKKAVPPVCGGTADHVRKGCPFPETSARAASKTVEKRRSIVAGIDRSSYGRPGDGADPPRALGPLNHELQPVTIELYLVQPAATLRWGIDPGCELGRDEAGLFGHGPTE